MLIKIFVFFCVQITCSTLASAELYQWVDENGVVTFKDSPPSASRKFKKVKVYNDSDFQPAPPLPVVPRSSKPAAYVQPAAKKDRFSGTVEIYVTDWCGYCKRALAYMKSKDIPYTAHNIEKDSYANQRYKELGGRGVPLIVFGSEKMSGFSESVFENYMNSAK